MLQLSSWIIKRVLEKEPNSYTTVLPSCLSRCDIFKVGRLREEQSSGVFFYFFFWYWGRDMKPPMLSCSFIIYDEGWTPQRDHKRITGGKREEKLTWWRGQSLDESWIQQEYSYLTVIVYLAEINLKEGFYCFCNLTVRVRDDLSGQRVLLNCIRVSGPTESSIVHYHPPLPVQSSLYNKHQSEDFTNFSWGMHIAWHLSC